ncbi:hypothetical protein Bhyg_13045 [Pseudolycoriella hygida]|uniref:Uncharacterized protein n=1 Tax=Pseudolycoriella hygida TaxID=35572 RepID=A0A9Q0N001_9DIPT|nr:hypothetical protein Bhyg_13045 [Pseudolycoriella hygida]
MVFFLCFEFSFCGKSGTESRQRMWKMPTEHALRCLIPSALRSSPDPNRVSDSIYVPGHESDEPITPLTYRKCSYSTNAGPDVKNVQLKRLWFDFLE